MTADYLVPGRACGPCRACAVLPGVDAATLGDDRRQQFHCLWRKFDQMEEDWRPDRSGMVITLAQAPGEGSWPMVQLWLTDDPDRLKSAEFASVAAGFLSSGTAIALTIPSSPDRTVRLDPLIAAAVEARDLDGVLGGIHAALALLQRDPAKANSPFQRMEQVRFGMPLIEGRECGECTACCVIPAIDDPQLTKPAGQACPNCIAGGGCAVYQARPETCRTYHCMWRHLAALPDSWRPDRSGLMVTVSEEPGHVPGMPAVEFLMINDAGRKLAETDDFASLVAGLTEAGTDTWLQQLYPDLSKGMHVRLTGWITEAVLAGDPAMAQTVMRERLAHLDSEIAKA